MSDDAELRAHLRNPPAGDLEYLRSLRDAALAYVEKETGFWYGAVRDRVVTRRGSGSEVLKLPGPIPADYGAAILVQERTYPGADAVDVLAGDTNGWEWDGRNLVRRGLYRWWENYQYTFTYQQGLLPDEEPPADVRLAIEQLVAQWYEQRLPVSEAVRSAQKVPFAAGDLLGKRKPGRI